MKKLIITTAISLTIFSVAADADARSRYKNLSPSEPTVEVNFSALRQIAPEAFVDTGERRDPQRLGNSSGKFGEIRAQSRPAAKVESTPVKKTEVEKPASKPIAQTKPSSSLLVNPQKPVPQIVTNQQQNNTTPLKITKPAAPAKSEIPLEVPKFDTPPTAPALVKAPVAKAELQQPPSLDSLPKPSAQPAAPKIPDLPPLPDPKAQVEKIKTQEFPKLADISFPEDSATIPAPPPSPAAPAFAPPPPPPPSNQVVLPPLFPEDSSTSAALPTPPSGNVPAPSALPSLDSLFAENQATNNSADSIEIPKLPDSGIDDLPAVPAPEIANVQINTKMPEASIQPQGDVATSFSVPFNETQTEFPLSEQARLQGIANAMKADSNVILTVSGYASGSAAQSSQAKRTSLSRALSVRRFLLENGVQSSQIVVRPYGNESSGGVPDRVDIDVSKKAGA